MEFMNRNEEMRGYVSMDGEKITPYFHLSLKNVFLQLWMWALRSDYLLAIILAIPTSVLPIETADTSYHITILANSGNM